MKHKNMLVYANEVSSIPTRISHQKYHQIADVSTTVLYLLQGTSIHSSEYSHLNTKTEKLIKQILAIENLHESLIKTY